MNYKKLLFTIPLVIIIAIGGILLLNFNTTKNKNTLFDSDIYSSGENKSSFFEMSLQFDKNKGNIVTYEVENLGDNNIFILMNDEEQKDIKPNSIGSVSKELTKDDEVLKFKAYAKDNKVNIKYNIDQSN